MKPTLAAYRRRILAFSALVMVLVGIGSMYAFVWYTLNQGERYLDRQTRLLSRELKTLFEVQELVLGGLAAKKPLEIDMFRDFLPEQLGFLGICSSLEGGKILSVFRGPAVEGLAVPRELLSPTWHATAYLAEDGRQMFTFALPYGEHWLLGGFSPDRIFASLDPLLDGHFWSLLADSRGRILVAWNGDDVLLSGGFLPRSFLRSETLVPDRITPRDVYVLRRSIPHGLALVSGIWRHRAFWEAAKQGIAVACGVLSVMVLILLPINIAFRKVSLDFQRIASVVGHLGWHVRHMPDPLQAIDTFRRQWDAQDLEQRVEFRNAAEVVGGFRDLLEAVASQGQELAALYQETTAMQSEIEHSNAELRGAMERLEELGMFAQTAVEARSAKEAAVALVRSLVAFSGARSGAVVLCQNEIAAVIAYEGDAALREGFCRAVERWGRRGHSGTSLRGSDGKLWRAFPILYLGKTLGAVWLAETEGGTPVFQRVEGIMALFIPHMGGIVRAHLLVDEVRRSYHYLAFRFQGISSTYHEETGDHLRRIRDYALFLGRRVGLDEETLEDLSMYSMLHDIGKLKVPLEILTKPGALDTVEFAEVKRHTQYGADLLGDSEWLGMARDICLYHHERWDGSGYPEGRRGVAIPLVARIVGLADVYDALRSPRCYKPPFSHEETRHILLHGDGRVLPGHFDPALLDVFVREHHVFEEIFDRYRPEDQGPVLLEKGGREIC